MKIKIINSCDNISKQRTEGYKRYHEITGAESLDVEFSTEEIEKHQESNLVGPMVTKIKVMDHVTGKICHFNVRVGMKNGRPVLETSPTAGGDGYKKLTFGKLQHEPERRAHATAGTSGTVKSSDSAKNRTRVDARTTMAAMSAMAMFDAQTK